MALSARAQPEVTSAIDAKVVILVRRVDHHPVTVNQRLRVNNPRLWAATRPIIPNRRLCAHHHKLLPQTVPRRFCTAVAAVSDGHKHTVNYSIAEDAGMIGMTWGVEWCVVGLDRNWAYNPACKMARP